MVRSAGKNKSVLLEQRLHVRFSTKSFSVAAISKEVVAGDTKIPDSEGGVAETADRESLGTFYVHFEKRNLLELKLRCERI